MAGKFYSTTITTTGDDEDLFTTLKTTLSLDSLVAKKLWIASSDNIGIDINDIGVYSTLWLDGSSQYRLELDDRDILVRSVKIETTGHAVWIGIIY